MSAALVAVAALILQATAPLKKSDLIRLLSATTLAPAEIADLVQRRCVSFTPSARDKADLRALGADDALMRRLDECARKIAPLRAQARLREAVVTAGGRAAVTVELRRGDGPATGIRVVLRGSGRLTGGPDAELNTDAAGVVVFEFGVGSAPGTYRLLAADPAGQQLEGTAGMDLTVRPAPLEPTASRTGFVSGTAQRARVGTRLPLPLVFEARDTANRPVAGRPVSLVGVNARVVGAGTRTDSAGQVRAFVVLGERAGAAHVSATIGGIERQAALIALPGPPARLVVQCGSVDVAARVALAAGADQELAVIARDALGNDVPLTGVRVMVGDEKVVRLVGEATSQRFTLHGERAGTTNLVVLGSGLRATLLAAVAPAGAAPPPPCRPGVPRG